MNFLKRFMAMRYYVRVPCGSFKKIQGRFSMKSILKSCFLGKTWHNFIKWNDKQKNWETYLVEQLYQVRLLPDNRLRHDLLQFCAGLNWKKGQLQLLQCLHRPHLEVAFWVLTNILLFLSNGCRSAELDTVMSKF